MMIDLDALEQAARAATPGPWAWSINKRSRDVRLYAQHSGQLTVMDFVRYGMQSAQPRFRVPPIDLMSEMSECYPHPDAQFIALVNPATVLALIARLRAAEAALRAIHEFANDDGNWEHEEIIADDGMFIGCDGRYTIDVMASDALKGLADAVPNV